MNTRRTFTGKKRRRKKAYAGLAEALSLILKFKSCFLLVVISRVDTVLAHK